MIDTTWTQSELLSMWERGEGERRTRRALALLPAIDGREPVGTRDAALLSLRERLFGSAFAGVTSCPRCGEEIELEFEADEVRRVPAAKPLEAEGVSFRLPSSDDLAAIEDSGDVGTARERLLERCLLGASPAELPAATIEAIARRMAECDPQADVQLDASCPTCEHRWREPFDIASFLWTELSVLAKRILIDVHDLALAYGWSEQDILALSPARRAAYLELVR